jgi:hypothetical protein
MVAAVLAQVATVFGGITLVFTWARGAMQVSFIVTDLAAVAMQLGGAAIVIAAVLAQIMTVPRQLAAIAAMFLKARDGFRMAGLPLLALFGGHVAPMAAGCIFGQGGQGGEGNGRTGQQQGKAHTFLLRQW